MGPHFLVSPQGDSYPSLILGSEGKKSSPSTVLTS